MRNSLPLFKQCGASSRPDNGTLAHHTQVLNRVHVKGFGKPQKSKNPQSDMDTMLAPREIIHTFYPSWEHWMIKEPLLARNYMLSSIYSFTSSFSILSQISLPHLGVATMINSPHQSATTTTKKEKNVCMID